MDFRDIQFKILHFDQLLSTNIHAQELIQKGELDENTVIWADHQSSGKGQRGRVWDSQPAENLLFSVCLKPNISIKKAFTLNKLIAIALYDLLDNMAVEDLSIKWPNDLLVGTDKIAGLLIENSIQGQLISQTIIGIGLNVNQTSFSHFERAATSLRLVLEQELNRRELLVDFLNLLAERVQLLQAEDSMIDKIFHERLYGLDKAMLFQIGQDQVEGRILKVNEHGQLILSINGKEEVFSERELRFID